MRKKLLWIALALMMLVALPACNKKSDTELAKEAAEGFMTAFSEMKIEDAQKYVLDKDKEFLKDDEFVKDMDKPENKFFIDILKSAKFEFKSGEIKDGAEEGTLVYTITSKNIMSIISQSMDDILAGKSEEEIMAGVDVEKMEDQTKDVEIAVKKEGDSWKVAEPENIMMELVGLGDFDGLMEDMGGEATNTENTNTENTNTENTANENTGN
ncbi:hypothetical protein [Aedoeadaptatus pacaensis]|uniref:hypothetical protein n=1 Tax=Aedoeadaptatus pacaensis TaxID=1776390 RepID=UPI0008393440|nr:hypothetical protein [Peptoniphilus pacaensis]